MMRGSQYLRISILNLAVLLFAAAMVACGGATEPLAPVPATPAGDAPAGVLRARDSVLDYLRNGVNECVPPQQASWTSDDVPNPPDGYDVYRFNSGGCAISITTTSEPAAEPIYHVSLGDGATGFCWQAVVDDHGQILLTGSAAQTDPTLGNPARNYCEQQGFTFEMVTLSSGQLCGRCTFDDGQSCNAWAYFHGACTPESADIAP